MIDPAFGEADPGPGTPAAAPSETAMAAPAAAGPAAGWVAEEGRQRGYRARPLADVVSLLGTLADGVADEALAALGPVPQHDPDLKTVPQDGQAAGGPCLYLMSGLGAPPWLAAIDDAFAHIRGGRSTRVRGFTDWVSAGAATVPAVQTVFQWSRLAASRLSGAHRSRAAVLDRADIASLWFVALGQACHVKFGQGGWAVQVMGVGGLPARRSADLVLVADLPVGAVLWARHRRPFRAADTTVAQWVLLDAAGGVAGAGLSRCTR